MLAVYVIAFSTVATLCSAECIVDVHFLKCVGSSGASRFKRHSTSLKSVLHSESTDEVTECKHIRVIEKCAVDCADTKLAQLLHRIKSKNCVDKETFKKFRKEVVDFQKAWRQELDKNSCSGDITQLVKEACKEFASCEFGKALKEAVGPNEPTDAMRYAETSLKFEIATGLYVNNNFTALPPECGPILEPTSAS